LNVDAEGFDYMDRKLLLAVIDKFFGGPVGLDNLAAAIGEEREGAIRQYGPAASAVILPQLTSQNVTFDNVHAAVGAGVQVRLFG
ncbi:hypothetical protein ONO39_27135, partial [Salmonella enterica subsp. enterica serovar Anatum]|nr:hypothetical protein [Salmonella enterica subsp. enterica serovar Anatum]